MAIYFNNMDIIFSFFMFLFVILSLPVHFFQKNCPVFFIKFFFYGNLALPESEVKSIQSIEMSKSYFGHFYLFGSIFGLSSLFYMISVYFFNVDVNEYVKFSLKTLIKEDEPVSVITTLTAMVLFTIQCLRRGYETVFVHVFSKSSKMNLLHYVVAQIHYGLVIMSIVGRAPLFCGEQTRNNITWIELKTKILIAPCILLFLYASYEQFRSHAILANLRKSNKTGRVVTEAYQIPYGGLFRYTSSPHRLCEVLIYLALVLLMQTRTFIIIFVWVFTNQIHFAFTTHQWYKKKFENYPSDRFAMVPYII